MKKYKSIKTTALLIIILSVLIASCEKDDLSDVNELIYVRHNGADMPAHIHGNASEKIFLILLHGGPGANSMVYRSGVIRDDLEKACAVVYFDQRGSGMSLGNYSRDDVNIDIMAEDVMALVKVIRYIYGNESRFFLMGHSWGGMLGTAILAKDDNQEFFRGWINMDGPHDWKGLYFEIIRNFREISKEQLDEGNNEDFWQEICDKVEDIDTVNYDRDNFFYLNQKAHESEDILRDADLVDRTDSETGLDMLANIVFVNNPLTTFWNNANTVNILLENGLEDYNYSEELANISIPSLYLWGRYDMVVPFVIGQEACENLGTENKRFVLFERSCHSIMAYEPEKFAEEVIAFMNRYK